MREAFVATEGFLSVSADLVETRAKRRAVLLACGRELAPGERVRIPWRLDRHGATRLGALVYLAQAERWVPTRLLARVGAPQNAPPMYALEVVTETAREGLRARAWGPDWIEFERTEVHPVPRWRLLDPARVWSSLLRAEHWRTRLGPREAIARARARGRHAPAAGATRRAWISDLVFALDLFFPRGPNCFRRVLAESALDSAAAKDEIALGFDPASTGHAWIVPREIDVAREAPPRFPVVHRV